ncbi:MAG TPA: PstS family phosphate ABC transporter substrate-binding protein [Haliangium sp.]|nr:PstS family phosphate ABC transporter substrate-binding protein [Haliangium sp.]
MPTASPPDASRETSPEISKDAPETASRLLAPAPGPGARRWLALGLAALVACGAPADEDAPAPGPRVLRVEGSTTLYRAVTHVSERFEAQHPGIDVLTGKSSSSEGLSMLIHGTVDVATCSRPPTAHELERARQQRVVLKPYQVGYDAIVVIVHPHRFASVPALSLAQVRDVFFDGRLRDWSWIAPPAAPAGASAGTPPEALVGVPINVYVRAPAVSGTALMFVELLAGDWQAPFIDGARLMISDEDMVAAVAADPDGIGFAPIGLIDERVRAVALSSDGRRFIAPSQHTIRDLSYPLRRNLYLVTRGTPRGALNLFLRFVLGPAGQAALAPAGVQAMH